MSNRASIVQGDDKLLVVTVDQDIDAPSDVKFVVERHGTLAFQKSLVLGGIVQNSPTEFVITVNSADTLTLKPGNYQIQGLWIDDVLLERALIFSPPEISIIKRLGFV
jgi:hypothetical protein